MWAEEHLSASGSGAHPRGVGTTVSRNPRQLEKVSWTAVASEPAVEPAIRAHFSLPLRFP